MNTQIFISYSHINASLVTRLRHQLMDHGATIWIDHENLPPGTPDWQHAIRAGLRTADVVVYTASPEAVDSVYVQAELNIAHDLKKHIIPFWLDGEVWSSVAPFFLTNAQHIDARGEHLEAGIKKLLQRLESNPVSPAQSQSTLPPLGSAPASANSTSAYHLTPMPLYSLGFRGYSTQGIEYILPPLCVVPAGAFLMGKDKHYATLPTYQIARYPVTVAEYVCFVRARHREPHNWQRQLGKLDHPVVWVTWRDALLYAKWLAECTSQPWRLPTEAEWEKAARGTDGRIYPWGDTFDKARCNICLHSILETTSVGSYPESDPNRSGASPYGVEDMAGNVWEWTGSKYYRSTKNRVRRGGSWDSLEWGAQVAYRDYKDSASFSNDNGFRLVCAAPILAGGSPHPEPLPHLTAGEGTCYSRH